MPPPPPRARRAAGASAGARASSVAAIHARAVELLGDGRAVGREELGELASLRERAGALGPAPAPYRHAPGYAPYPAVDDPELPAKLAAKREFAEHAVAPGARVSAAGPQPQPQPQPQPRRPRTGADVDRLWSERCAVADRSFELTRMQLVVRNFLAPGTPYNGLIMFHGTGVGKTCTAVTVAEQFKDRLHRGVIVLMRPGLRDNFQRTVFDIGRVKQQQQQGAAGAGGALDYERPTQCTGTAYTDQVPDRARLAPEQVASRVARLIRSRYTFLGLTEFANLVDALIADVSKAVADERLHAHFSDSVIVVDEAHNMRGENDKKVTPMLMRVLRSTSNVKLLLLTATPMFNRASDVVDLLNLLLANDKRPRLAKADMFDAEGQLVDAAAAERLRRACRGYVSHAPGNDPFSFPARVPASASGDRAVMRAAAAPRRDIRGARLPASSGSWLDAFGALEVVASEMGAGQLRRYEEVERRLREQLAAGRGEDEAGAAAAGEAGAAAAGEDGAAAGEDGAGAGARASLHDEGMMLSNVAFPAGVEKLMDAFRRVQDRRPMQVEYRPGVPRFLDGARALAEYAPKIGAIVERVLRSTGVVMVYSRFLYRGLVPLAIALEHRGFQRYGAPPMLSGAGGGGGGGGPSYAVICGHRDIRAPADTAAAVAALTAPGNVDGASIKVVLISDSGSEGIDLKYVREVHVLEPWYHINKIEQVVGRASRFCSHRDLPLAHRNLTVYLHATRRPHGRPDSDVETIDLRAYRIAALKQRGIREVEAILRQTAIDAPLLEGRAEVADAAIDIETSQGVRVRRYRLASYGEGEGEGGKPGRKKNAGAVGAFGAFDASTYDADAHSYHGYRYRSLLLGFFSGEQATERRASATYDELWQHVRDGIRRDGDEPSQDRMSAELHGIVSNGDELTFLARTGRLVHRGDRYAFQPDDERIVDALTDRERASPPPPGPVAMDAAAMMAQRHDRHAARRPYAEVVAPPSAAAAAPGAGAGVDASTQLAAASNKHASSASAGTGTGTGTRRLMPRVDVAREAAAATLLEVAAAADQLLRRTGLPASYADAALDATVDRAPHVKLLDMAAAAASRQPLADESTRRRLLASLRGAGVLAGGSPKTAAAAAAAAAQTQHVAVRSPYVPFTLRVDLTNGETTPMPDDNLRQQQPQPGTRLEPTAFGITAAVVPLVQRGQAAFKVLNNTNNNLKLVQSGRGSGCVCHQNAFLTSERLKQAIERIAGPVHGPAALAALKPNADKRLLCTVMELVIRKHKPAALLRVGHKLAIAE
jgi:hypothetical protein